MCRSLTAHWTPKHFWKHAVGIQWVFCALVKFVVQKFTATVTISHWKRDCISPQTSCGLDVENNALNSLLRDPCYYLHPTIYTLKKRFKIYYLCCLGLESPLKSLLCRWRATCLLLCCPFCCFWILWSLTPKYNIKHRHLDQSPLQTCTLWRPYKTLKLLMFFIPLPLFLIYHSSRIHDNLDGFE